MPEFTPARSHDIVIYGGAEIPEEVKAPPSWIWLLILGGLILVSKKRK